MKTTIIALLTLVISLPAVAQDSCNCEQSLGKLIDRIESGYPGFAEKTTDTLLYNHFKNRLVQKSKSTDNANCYGLLKSYLSYFRDAHMSLIQLDKGEDPPAVEDSATRVDLTLDDFYEYLAKSTDVHEGVWKSPYYKVGIIKVDDEYQGFIIEASNPGWAANEVKFRLMENGEAAYYMGNHSLEEDSYELIESCILSFKNVNAVFVKELPEPKLTEDEISERLASVEGFYFRKLTDRTSLLCISSFEDAYVQRIEKIVSDNGHAIENCENLIIDLRNNLGGTYDAYDEILPYILTGNTRSVGSEFLVTRTLIDDVESWFDDEAGKEKARRWIGLFRGHIGTFVNVDTSRVTFSDIKIAEHSPRQIVVLANKRTASSGEAFVLEAKQSKKVKILGVPTYGAIDYGSATLFDFGCPDYRLMMPTWRAMRLPEYPLDNIGIQPDVYLDESVGDWVEFAVDYLEN